MKSHGLMLNLPGWQNEPGIGIIREGRVAMKAFEGDHDAMVEHLHKFRDAGVGEVHIQLDPETPQAVEWFGRVIESYRAA
jgi:hypothetical protein